MQDRSGTRQILDPEFFRSGTHASSMFRQANALHAPLVIATERAIDGGIAEGAALVHREQLLRAAAPTRIKIAGGEGGIRLFLIML